MTRISVYTCTALADLLIEGRFTRKEICPPGFVGEDKDNFGFL